MALPLQVDAQGEKRFVQAQIDSVSAIGSGITGRPEGPCAHALSPDKPFVNGIDATLFEDEDGKVYGPCKMRHESVPCAGGANFFKAKDGHWYRCYVGNDNQSPWREKPGTVRVEFDEKGKIGTAKNQPAFMLTNLPSGKP